MSRGRGQCPPLSTLPRKDPPMKHDLQRLVEQWRAQRDGCRLIADDYAAKAAGPEVWNQPGNERQAKVYEQYCETYADVVEELEATFPWLKPEESEEAA